MKFLWNVIKIFFRNKYREIRVNLYRNSILEAVIIISVVLVVAVLGGMICYGTGYLFVDVLEWIELSGEETYTEIGFMLWFVILLVTLTTYLIFCFFRWIWTNIKIAIAEAKEL